MWGTHKKTFSYTLWFGDLACMKACLKESIELDECRPGNDGHITMWAQKNQCEL